MLQDKIDKLLKNESRKLKTLQFAMYIPELEAEYSYSSTTPNQQFHGTSIGKLFTATLIFMAIERGLLSLDTLINTALDKEILSGLFVVDNQDFQDEVTIEQLLGHTSGVNDYFEGKTMDGTSFIDEVISHPDKFWTPQELLDFTRIKQKAIAKPGEKFLYSDTGYVLLGLIIEKILNIPFYKALETHILKPIGMDNTGFSFYSENFDQSKLAPLFVNGIDAHFYKSLSCDFSGGGIFTTAEDLLKFFHQLQNEKLISRESLETMATFQNRLHSGLHYGLGMMQAHFNEFFFMLKNLPNLQGHIGITSAHAWYDPVSKATFVLNVGNSKDMAKSFRILIKVLQIVQKEKKLKNQ